MLCLFRHFMCLLWYLGEKKERVDFAYSWYSNQLQSELDACKIFLYAVIHFCWKSPSLVKACSQWHQSFRHLFCTHVCKLGLNVTWSYALMYGCNVSNSHSKKTIFDLSYTDLDYWIIVYGHRHPLSVKLYSQLVIKAATELASEAAYWRAHLCWIM